MTETTLETESYRLYYWPSLQGRGEFVRLLFEETGVPYLDMARLPPEAGGGIERIHEMRRGEHKSLLPYAPPFLRVGPDVIGQTAVICDFVARRFGLVPADDFKRTSAQQLQLTIMDVVAEVHDTHHPVSIAKYYEDQKEEAAVAARGFITERLPHWLSYFDKVLERSDGPWLLGPDFSYPDLSLFQLTEGLRYAFPKAMSRAAPPRLLAHHQSVRERETIARYLKSNRRLPFNEDGIFRYYEALDLEG